ncbi:hypothetical protein POVWA1_001100 [Plasmodium ovale wallikeri]|uniref:Uncharacterized protein n=1 Tax=Plasmodium ovale wallikeri TaxID=864142 RepID=A0A1A8YFX4_PLAOA|nr:hypothetical protein POVWA1_001100 [Plasmodium ovale wallikeri]
MSIRALLRYSPSLLFLRFFLLILCLFPFSLNFQWGVKGKLVTWKTGDVENWRCGKLEMWKTGNVGISLKAIRASVPYFPLPFSA